MGGFRERLSGVEQARQTEKNEENFFRGKSDFIHFFDFESEFPIIEVIKV